MNRKLVAVDIGAGSGKMAYAEFDGERLHIKEYKDFANRPVSIGTALYWDVFSLYNAILDGLSYFRGKYGEADTFGIDTWGATYGLLDASGRLLEPVYHYRDLRTDTVMKEMDKVMSARELFGLTGCQCNRTYSLPQLYTYRLEKNPVLDNASKMLLLPDLLGYFLTGSASTEMTIAGTSCLMERQQEDWSREVADRFSIPFHLYTNIVEAGTIKGELRGEIRSHTGIRQTKLAAVTEHDSASAEAAVPGFDQDSMYISIGTNISMGVERKECMLTETAYRCGFKNTGGIGRRKIIYRDFSACWHLSEFMRTRREQGVTYTHPSLIAEAGKCTAEVPWFDTEAEDVNHAGGDFTVKMNRYFARTGQRTLTQDSEFAKSIFESIALKTQFYAKRFASVGLDPGNVCLISGGARNEYLVQMICSALGKEVSAGMPYATLSGNLLSQLLALGESDTVEDMRSISGRSHEMKRFSPVEKSRWEEAGERYGKIMQKAGE